MLVGAILCGGASRRMGEPKALVEVDGVPMALRVAAALSAAGASDVVLVGGDPAWSELFGLKQVPDRWPGEGPLGGLATALLDVPAACGAGDPTNPADMTVLVAACDQPWLDGPSLWLLVAALEANVGVEVAVARTESNRRQPFPAAWRSTPAPALQAAVAAGARRADAAFDLVSVVEVTLPDAVLADVDWPADLRVDP